ncbi:MAG: hypothetical protein ABIC18_05355 [Candidatus Omnitrophota bacterium]
MEIGKPQNLKQAARPSGFAWFTALLVISAMIMPGCLGLGGKMGGIKNLIKLGENDKYKKNVLEQETVNFQKVKAYINSSNPGQGISKDIAVIKFGEPILVFSEAEGERWVYKSAEAKWFGGEKIYLFFNKGGKLSNWEYIDVQD